MPLTERILSDCRGAVGEVRFGFGSKRQVWAFEDRHREDVVGLVEDMASHDPTAFLDLALLFHEEFAAVSNAWRVRDRIESLVAELCQSGPAGFLDRASSALVDDHLAVRHWLLSAYVSASPLAVFRGLEAALGRAYQPQDQWALLSRLRALSEVQGWSFAPDTVRLLASLAQFSFRSEDRLQALDLLARFGGPSSTIILTRATRGDSDPAVRARAGELLLG